MSIRFFRLMSLFFLLIALPQLAAAQGYWQVRDTATNQIVYPNGVVSMFEDIAYPTVAQRVYRIANVSNFQLQISPCTISGDSSFIIGANTISGTVYPGLATSVAIQHLASGVGTQSATVMCSTNVGYIIFQVSGRVLDPSPYIVLDTLAGQNLPKGSTFNFGSTPAGTAVDKDFKITNMGNQPLTLSLSTSGPYSVVTAPPSPLAKGASATFRLRLLSSVTGTASGQLSIANNDPNDNPYYIFLTGTVTVPLAPQIQITDNGNGGVVVAKGSTVNLGNVPVNTTATRTFTLKNIGNTTLTISNPTTFVSGVGYSVWSSPSNTLGSGSSTTFTIAFQSGSSGTYTGTASLASNDPDDNPFTFNLQATIPAPTPPRIRIVDSTTGQTVTPGATVSFGSTAANTAVNHIFTVYNDGPAGSSLALANFNSFVSGTGFSLPSPPTSPIPGGSSRNFTIRLLSANAGTYNGTASLQHNDPSTISPFNFSLQGTVNPALPTITATATDAEASETAGNNGTITLTRTGSTASSLTVTVSTSGTATSGSDYTAIPTSQTFAAGQSTVTIPVSPINDAAFEDVETVTVTVAPAAGYSVGSPSSATVSILNNDYTPCTTGGTSMCLQNGRFEATLSAVANGSNYTGQAISLGDNSGGFWLFSPDNVEVGVKILDGTAVNGKFWIYHGAATDVAYTLTVKDRANASRIKVLTKAAGTLCGGADFDTFAKSLQKPKSISPAAVPNPLAASTCIANSTTTCLLGNRFQVRVLRSGAYQQVIPVTSQTAFFWFFAPDNLEIFVKVLDGTALNSKYWVFYGSMTDQAYTVEVTDTATGLVKNYPSGAGLCGNADTSAF